MALLRPRDSINTDQFNLNYRMAPDMTVGTHRMPGRKRAKEHISVLMCTNQDASETFELMFIGNAHNQHPFKVRTAQELGFD